MAEKPVKHNEIIEDGVFSGTIEQGKQMLDVFNALEKGIKSLAIESTKYFAISVKTLSDLESRKAALTEINRLDQANTEVIKQKSIIESGLQKLEQERAKAVAARYKAEQELQKAEAQKLKVSQEQEKLEKERIKTDTANLALQKKLEQQAKAQTAATENSTKALRQMQRELANLPAGSKEFNELAKKAGALKDKINDAKDAVKAFSSESKLTNAKTLFGQIGNDLKELNFSDAADKAKTLASVVKSMSFAEAAKGMKDFGSAILNVGKALLLNPFTLVIAGIAALALAVKETYDAYQRADEIVASFNETLIKQEEITRKIIASTEEWRRQNQVLRGELTEHGKKRLDAEDEFTNKFIENRKAERKEIDDARAQFAEANKATYTEIALGDAGRYLTLQRNLENGKKFAKLESDIKKKFGETEVALRAEYTQKIINIDLTTGEKRIDIAKKTSKAIATEQKKANTDFGVRQTDPFGTAIKAPGQTLEEYEAEEQKKIDIQIASHNEQLRIENEFIRYELDALRGKYGKEEEIVAAEQLKTKVMLGTANEEELAAYKAYLDSKNNALKEANKKQIDETFKTIEQITSGIKAGLQKRAELQQQADQKDIDMKARMIEVQSKLAAEGKDNVLAETIAATTKAEEKKLQDAKKAAKQQETIALIEAFTKTLQAALKSGKPFLQAFGEALASEGLVSAAFSKLFAGFYEGTEDTGTTAHPLDNKGGRVIIAHDNERILPKRLNDELGGMSNEELVERALAYPEMKPMFFPRVVSVEQTVQDFNTRQIAAMTKEIQGLRSDMASKPVPSFELGNKMGEYDERWKSDLSSVIIHHKKSQTRPSLRLNG